MSATASARPTARSALLALSLGHGAADICSSALWALLPFLVVERHYSYTAVGVFALTASLGSALLQPLFGAHGDRREAVWLLPAGLIVAGLGGLLAFTWPLIARPSSAISDAAALPSAAGETA